LFTEKSIKMKRVCAETELTSSLESEISFYFSDSSFRLETS